MLSNKITYLIKLSINSRLLNPVIIKNCTIKDKDTTTRRLCFNCRKVGHTSNSCPEQKLCNICRQPGHLMKDCPNKDKINKRCLICDSEDHLKNRCPNKKI